MAIALQRTGRRPRKVVAVIGDGAMTAGMAFEALNHAGGMDPEPNLLVILNDNRMSISENVGGLTKMLGRMMSSRTLNAMREGGKKLLGDKRKPTARFMRRWEEHWKGMFVPSTLFEEMGFHYTGPIDGHDMPDLVEALKTLQDLKGPQLLHVITTKGKGYELAEGDQIEYHAVSPFDPERSAWSRKPAPAKPTYTAGVRRLAVRHGRCRRQAAGDHAGDARRLGPGAFLSKEYPERYFDVAIAEQHAVTLAAGMACEGAKPVVAIYSTFLQRAYDQLIHDVALQNLDVLFAIDRGGVVGPDGATHAGSFDFSFLRCIPNMVVMAPADENECRQMLSTGFRHRRPGRRALSARQRPRRGGAAERSDALPIGKAELRQRGARRRPARLRRAGARGGSRRRRTRPDRGQHALRQAARSRRCILELARSHEGLVTLEDNVVMGGAGSGVAELLAARRHQPCRSCTSACPTAISTTPAAKTCWPMSGWISPVCARPSASAGPDWAVRWSAARQAERKPVQPGPSGDLLLVTCIRLGFNRSERGCALRKLFPPGSGHVPPVRRSRIVADWLAVALTRAGKLCGVRGTAPATGARGRLLASGAGAWRTGIARRRRIGPPRHRPGAGRTATGRRRSKPETTRAGEHAQCAGPALSTPSPRAPGQAVPQFRFERQGPAVRDFARGYKEVCAKVAKKIWDEPNGRKIKFDIAGKPGVGIEIPIR